MAGHDIIVMGASAGGVEALKQLQYSLWRPRFTRLAMFLKGALPILELGHEGS